MDRKPHELLFKLVTELVEKKKRDLDEMAGKMVGENQRMQKKDKEWQRLTAEQKRLEESLGDTKLKLEKVESRYKSCKWRLSNELGQMIEDEALRVKVRLLIEDRSKVEAVLADFMQFEPKL